jgi:hypothetical protein
MRILSTLFWLFLAVLSTATLIRVADEYVTTVNSLQASQWAVSQFDVPADGAERTNLVLEIRNHSQLDLTVKELEVYLWLDDMTVGKTYGPFEPRLVPRGTVARVPLVIELMPAALSEARAKPAGSLPWRATGSYKISTPLTGTAFVYYLNLDLAP